MKRTLLGLMASACLMLPTCLNVDQAGLAGLGSNLVCEVATSGLPFSDHIDYCSYVNINLGDLTGG